MLNYHERKSDKKYFLTMKYLLMKRRAIKKNLELCTKTEFLLFANQDNNFDLLFKDWVDSNFHIKLCPSIDRINNAQGYTLGNMQFITHSQNVTKGNYENPRPKPNGINKKQIKLSKDGKEKIFESGKAACDFLQISRNAVCIAIKKGLMIKGWFPTYVLNG